ncbi:transporter [Alkalihalobacillus alcalophilus ATCC 27647 = CGMCC 1.3604]|uniref:Transporter n=1 Tax=Alkalihalobacillus alcalophilus ATCC 27647 = CGMCC 1.3604 TaxID=1218173 RepID=J8TKS8_ALKAL|nr:chromate transporter [Alkalihalobacillus alcalophilus]AFV25763.1 chromate ion transporter [Alkalihalobacillus alcalophilus ATCC 27647 = CGMCC 1.3604]KGA96765.1 transporter [Alkalihalobacillus alcalophilus ATCC 27647 = CGMCC 1.3604]MED1561794.1 chromate transporter [Alkalihalobacillus alcalophilus]THG91809.1 transporter [Alkalihalobacillus alcalophilus ATCC 27647 = CGMCC 1.3604]
MIYWEIFLAFFIPGIVGYGGGPATIPLIQEEVVHTYGWLSTERFGELLAIGNALPGPIATKMAGYIGFEVGGVLGAAIALFATVAPSLLAMIFLLSILYKFKNSPKVKRMTTLVKPTIAVLLGVMAFEFFFSSYENSGVWQMIFLTIVSFLLLEKWKVHPAFVIVGALLYGAFFLGHT